MGIGEGSGDGAGTGSGASGADGQTGSGGILWQVIWLIILLLAAIWVSMFCAWWYILFIPFTVCVQPLAAITDILLRGVQLPYLCSKNMMEANTFGEALATAASTVPPTVLVVQN